MRLAPYFCCLALMTGASFAAGADGPPSRPGPPSTVPATMPSTAPAKPIIVLADAHHLKPGGTVTTALVDDTLEVNVISPGGIGRARLLLKEGRWPSKVRVTVRYAIDKPFTTLEGATIALEPAGPTPRAKQQELKITRTPAKAPLAFEANLPATTTTSKVLFIQWIDAYR